ncbi:MAG: hypothetical protein ACI9VR_001729 [Cognaticolwellia sp.]|jgi:hypothetical protein
MSEKKRGSVREDVDELLAESAAKVGKLVGTGERKALSRGVKRLSEGLAAVAGELFDAAADQSARTRPRRRKAVREPRAAKKAQDES